MQEPLATVCIPVFNAIATLPRCLEGVRLQYSDEIEILVVDNGSTDGSPELAETALADLRNVRVVRNSQNLGRIENWNRCLELAQGTYLKFIMASDVMWRGAVPRLLRAARTQPQAVIVGSRHELWAGGTQAIPSVRAAGALRHWDPATILNLVREGENPFWALNGMLIRREPVVTKALRFVPDIPYLSDVHFCARLAALGDTLFIETPTYWFNTAVKGRFHYAGMDPSKYLPEARRLYTDIGSLRVAGGAPPPDVDSSVLADFRRNVREGALAPTVATTLRLFAACPFGVRVRAAAAAAGARPREVMRSHLANTLNRVRRRLAPPILNALAILGRAPGAPLFRRRVGPFQVELDVADERSRHIFLNDYQPVEAAFLESWLRPGDRAVDVGAHVGYLTTIMATAVGATGRVLAIEPRPGHLARLRKLAQGSAGVIDARDRLTSWNDTPADLIRLDAEATEGGAWSGLLPDLQNHQPMILCELRGGAAPDSEWRRGLEEIQARGYRMLELLPVGFRQRSMTDLDSAARSLLLVPPAAFDELTHLYGVEG